MLVVLKGLCIMTILELLSVTVDLRVSIVGGLKVAVLFPFVSFSISMYVLVLLCCSLSYEVLLV